MKLRKIRQIELTPAHPSHVVYNGLIAFIMYLKCQLPDVSCVRCGTDVWYNDNNGFLPLNNFLLKITSLLLGFYISYVIPDPFQADVPLLWDFE